MASWPYEELFSFKQAAKLPFFSESAKRSVRIFGYSEFCYILIEFGLFTFISHKKPNFRKAENLNQTDIKALRVLFVRNRCQRSSLAIKGQFIQIFVKVALEQTVLYDSVFFELCLSM